MNRITKISRIRNLAVFRDFEWPDDLEAFGRYNLIYGWNWSGKTTLSRVFRDLEMRRVPTNGEITLSTDEEDVRGDDFPQATLHVRVFNRDFVTESIFPFAEGDVPPIFVVGRESVEKQKEVAQLKNTLAKAQTDLESERSKEQDAERAFDRFRIDRAKVIKETLRSSGSNPYNDYDKSDFRQRAEEMATDGDGEGNRLSDTDRQKLLTQHLATPNKRKLEPVTYQLPELRALAEDASQLLSTTVISRAIQSLKDDPALSAWVHEGLGLHKDRNSERCLFCEQLIPKDRLAALEAHFSAEYEQFLRNLDGRIKVLQDLSKAAAELALRNRAELCEDLISEYDTAETALRQTLDSIRGFVDSLVNALTDKKDRAFRSLSLDVAVPEVHSNAVDRMNKVIREHNQACADFQSRVTQARQQLEADSVAQALDEFLTLRGAIQASEESVKGADADVKRLKNEIARLEREIVEHRKPAEELNEDLRKYLGHDELRLEIKDTGYMIRRNGLPAQDPSEGEMTAIALLYFLKSLQDRRFDLNNGVVVLDDPVSSLGANALYLAFGFIRERTHDAAQLFIFTHNFTFFRQVQNWFRHLKGQNRKDVRLYMLNCDKSQGQRCANIRWLDPLLEQYDSEYHYLFKCLYREAKVPTGAALERNLVFPNMARRVLEAFLAFRYPRKATLWQKMEAVSFDEAKKFRILRFLNTHSHSQGIGDPERDPSLLGEAHSVLKDLLELIWSEDRDHFLAMEKVVTPSTLEEEDG